MDEEIAKALHEAGVVKFGLFTYVSGKQGPIYIDMRVLPSHPKQMELVSRKLAKIVADLKPDAVAGAETAGIPFSTAISMLTKIPMIYVRKEPKGHGTGSMIEGHFEKGAKAVLVDDMITDGGSKLKFTAGLKQAGIKVEDVAVVLDREQGGMETLEKEGLRLRPLITLKELLKYMKEKEHLSSDKYNEIIDYLGNPALWEATHLGKKQN